MEDTSRAGQEGPKGGALGRLLAFAGERRVLTYLGVRPLSSRCS